MAIYNFGPWETKRLPVLDSNYPADVSVAIGKAATFSVVIAEEGKPEYYTYQWYVNGNAVGGATAASYTRTAPVIGTEIIYCVVTNKAGSVRSKNATLTVVPDHIFYGGVFQNGYGIDWTSNSGVAGCSVDGAWNIYAEGTGSWTSAWVTTPIDVTGKNKLIFTVTGNDSTTTDVNNRGYSRMGVTNAESLGGIGMIAAASIYNTPDYTTREYSVDLSNVSGFVYVKILIDKTNTNYNRDNLWVSAIRFE